MRPSAYGGYGPSQGETSKILLDQVTSSEEYKNVGVLLNKAIHQKFMAICQCRMIIDAVRGSHPYHYLLGFRSLNSEQNRLYASFAETREHPNQDLGSVSMYLPDDARRLWQEEIENFPIEFPQRSQL